MRHPFALCRYESRVELWAVYLTMPRGRSEISWVSSELLLYVNHVAKWRFLNVARAAPQCRVVGVGLWKRAHHVREVDHAVRANPVRLHPVKHRTEIRTPTSFWVQCEGHITHGEFLHRVHLCIAVQNDQPLGVHVLQDLGYVPCELAHQPFTNAS